jgi:hypothetical protein
VLVGTRDPAEKIREPRQELRARRLEAIERVDEVAERRRLRRRGFVDAQPALK